MDLQTVATLHLNAKITTPIGVGHIIGVDPAPRKDPDSPQALVQFNKKDFDAEKWMTIGHGTCVMKWYSLGIIEPVVEAKKEPAPTSSLPILDNGGRAIMKDQLWRSKRGAHDRFRVEEVDAHSVKIRDIDFETGWYTRVVDHATLRRFYDYVES